ncbi:ABC-2 transporter permease [Emergencia sp.]|uniref:ABC-2 transporter permease n=1 Tax=Emergencia sp. TaxID=1926557 RepID=UPI003AF1206B
MTTLITLIKKDLLLLRRSLTPASTMPIFISVIVAFVNPEFFMMLLVLILGAFFPALIIQILTIDESTRWKQFMRSLPVKPHIEVIARFVLLLMLSALSAVLIAALGFIASAAGLVETTGEYLFLFSMYGLVYGLLMGDVAIPVMYRFGAVNGKYVIMAFTFIPIIIGLYLISSGIPAFLYHVTKEMLIGAVVVAIAIATGIAFLYTWSVLKRRYEA